jgi:hypothetical protein
MLSGWVDSTFQKTRSEGSQEASVIWTLAGKTKMQTLYLLISEIESASSAPITNEEMPYLKVLGQLAVIFKSGTFPPSPPSR